MPRKKAVLQRRRRTVYRMMEKRHCGRVPCFCCGKHVAPDDASLEHVVPRSKGGSDAIENLSISHRTCNSLRGDASA